MKPIYDQQHGVNILLSLEGNTTTNWGLLPTTSTALVVRSRTTRSQGSRGKSGDLLRYEQILARKCPFTRYMSHAQAIILQFINTMYEKYGKVHYENKSPLCDTEIWCITVIYFIAEPEANDSTKCFHS